MHMANDFVKVLTMSLKKAVNRCMCAVIPHIYTSVYLGMDYTD